MVFSLVAVEARYRVRNSLFSKQICESVLICIPNCYFGTSLKVYMSLQFFMNTIKQIYCII